MNTKLGFFGVGAIIAFAVAIIAGGIYVAMKQEAEAPASGFNFTPPETITDAVVSSKRHVEFEVAVNAGDFALAKTYLAEKVFVVLDGSSCCGEKSAAEAVVDLERITGLQFIFDQDSNSVKNYRDNDQSQFPTGHLIRPGVFFSDLIVGVENNPTELNKASLSYLVENNKISILFINPGRDRRSQNVDLKQVLFTLPTGRGTEQTSFTISDTSDSRIKNGFHRFGLAVYYFGDSILKVAEGNREVVVVNANYGASLTDIYLVLLDASVAPAKQLSYVNLWQHPSVEKNRPYKISVKSLSVKNGKVSVLTSLRYGNNFEGADQLKTLDYKIEGNNLSPYEH